MNGRRWEWPTISIAVLLYGGFCLLTWHWQAMPVWLAAPLCGLLLAWHSSLQHETIHGHPTSSERLNELIGIPPLSLWLPYAVYRELHLAHHANGGRDLTDPQADPESHYRRPGTLAAAGRLERQALRWHATLAGRLLLGPALLVMRCWKTEVLRLAYDRRRRGIWLRHALAVIPLLVWVVWICRIPIETYLLLAVYPSISLSLLRSYTEHRAAPDSRHRTAVVEAGSFWSLLFLNNNLHVVHHRHPELPWYRLPAVWRELRPTLEPGPGMLYGGGYAEIAARHLFAAAAPVEHPGFERR
ncbi:MAG TPA: fatty acid desaturase [Aliidongia sp.]|nr:fatty acid desaturase [Aliidongia sp.]